jgi:hypothetical protein
VLDKINSEDICGLVRKGEPGGLSWRPDEVYNADGQLSGYLPFNDKKQTSLHEPKLRALLYARLIQLAKRSPPKLDGRAILGDTMNISEMLKIKGLVVLEGNEQLASAIL